MTEAEPKVHPLQPRELRTGLPCHGDARWTVRPAHATAVARNVRSAPRRRPIAKRTRVDKRPSPALALHHPRSRH
eukprot:12980462-Alexandrium_andersonii.AAC.1